MDFSHPLDLATLLNAISTLAIVLALVFTGLQVRLGNLSRVDQAAIAVIQASQSDNWTRALDLLSVLPAEARPEDIERAGPQIAHAVFEFGVRLETTAYLVYLRLVSMEIIDDLMGGVTLVYWARAKRWAERERTRTGNPKFLEWCEWLADRIAERRATRGHEPAHVRHRGWRE
jgi:hypothetical protein